MKVKDTTMNTAKQITTITVTDPDSNAPVEVAIFKHNGGGMFGVDASFLANTDEPVYDPFDGNQLEGEDFECDDDIPMDGGNDNHAAVISRMQMREVMK
jgi:hypothetical protein